MENNIFLENLWLPGDVREIRIKSLDGKTFSGYFDNPYTARIWVEKYEKNCFVYTTLNPVHPGLMARCGNKIKFCKTDSATSGKDIASINFLLIDVDPKRPTGISSTDQEKAMAKEVAEKVWASLGNPLIYGDSGNGYHLIYRCHTANPNDTKAFLQELDKRFGNEAVGIDLKVFDANRITKVLGTWAIKGENTPERPWRKSAVIETCQSSHTIEIPAIPVATAKSYTKNSIASHPAEPFEVRKFLAEHGVIVKKEKPWADGTMLVLESCVFDPSHKGGENGESSIIIHPSGMLTYQCFHSSCEGKKWEHLREAVGDPKKDIGGVFKTCDCCGKAIKLVQDPVGKWVAMEDDATTRHFCNRKKRTSKKAVDKDGSEVATATETEPVKKPSKKEKKFEEGKRSAMPLPADENIVLQIPEENGIGYVVTKDAVYQAKTFCNDITHEVYQTYTKIIEQPVRITEVVRDVWSSDESVTLVWGDSAQQRAVFPVEAVAFNKHVDKLAAKGIRIHSMNTKEAILYFAASLARNKEIKFRLASYKNGWLSPDRFIYGGKILSQKGDTQIEFQGSTYVPEERGTLEVWKKIVGQFQDDVGLSMRLGSAAVSPLLKILGCTSFIDHLWGGSTSGKTFSSIMAASMFGDPYQLVESWRQSRSGKETYFEEAGCLPSFLDESHQAKPDDLETTVYDFANEKGKGRATITTGGDVRKAKSKTWFGVLLSTGEGQIKEYTQKAGVEARMLEFMRVATISDEMGIMVNKAKNLLRCNFGHIGIELIRMVMKGGETLRATFDNNIVALSVHSLNNLQSRQVPYLAAVLTGCKMLDLLGVPLAEESKRLEYALSYMSNEVPIPTWQKAYSYMIEQAVKYRNKFVVIEKTEGALNETTTLPEHECWGKISEIGIDFLPDQAKRLLKDGGFDMSVLSLLKEEGKIAQNGKHNTTLSIIQGERMRVVRFFKETLDESVTT